MIKYNKHPTTTMHSFICVIQAISCIFIIIKYIYNPLLIDLLVGYVLVVA